jgi:hypothetical protein
MLFDTTRFPLVFLKEDPQADSHDTDTEAQFPGVKVKVIHDDIAFIGPASRINLW